MDYNNGAFSSFCIGNLSRRLGLPLQRKTTYAMKLRSLTYSLILLLCHATGAWAQQETDSLTHSAEGKLRQAWVHRIEAEFMQGTILHTNSYLQGQNFELRTMNHAASAKLKYAFMPPPESEMAHIYKGVYQGIGVARHDFNPQLGNPFSAFIFQGAQIARLSRQLTFNYEWNLGLTFGWHPYDRETNPDNLVIGSHVTAYINLDAYLAWRLSRQVDVNIGWSVSHFSNGNTKFPNYGLNTTGPRLSVAYYPNRQALTPTTYSHPAFQRHMSYDLTLFGSWRRRGYYTEENVPLVIPGSFAVFGFNFNPMYNLNHWFNLGVSLDGVYDRSANIEVDDIYDVQQISRPSTGKQMALGLSGRAEFVMPYFTINIGIGQNFVNNKGDFKGVYETVNLKLGITRALFANIGYCLNDFKHPNYLMLGLGLRFNHRRATR